MTNISMFRHLLPQSRTSFRDCEICHNLHEYNVMFSTKTSEVDALRKVRKFLLHSEVGKVFIKLAPVVFKFFIESRRRFCTQ